jgi:hypothetical protein
VIHCCLKDEGWRDDYYNNNSRRYKNRRRRKNKNKNKYYGVDDWRWYDDSAEDKEGVESEFVTTDTDKDNDHDEHNKDNDHHDHNKDNDHHDKDKDEDDEYDNEPPEDYEGEESEFLTTDTDKDNHHHHHGHNKNHHDKGEGDDVIVFGFDDDAAKDNAGEESKYNKVLRGAELRGAVNARI